MLSRNKWSPKVVGGQDAGKGEIGWQVGLSYSSSSSFASIFCGGTLINEKWEFSFVVKKSCICAYPAYIYTIVLCEVLYLFPS